MSLSHSTLSDTSHPFNDIHGRPHDLNNGPHHFHYKNNHFIIHTHETTCPPAQSLLGEDASIVNDGKPIHRLDPRVAHLTSEQPLFMMAPVSSPTTVASPSPYAPYANPTSPTAFQENITLPENKKITAIKNAIPMSDKRDWIIFNFYCIEEQMSKDKLPEEKQDQIRDQILVYNNNLAAIHFNAANRENLVENERNNFILAIDTILANHITTCTAVLQKLALCLAFAFVGFYLGGGFALVAAAKATLAASAATATALTPTAAAIAIASTTIGGISGVAISNYINKDYLDRSSLSRNFFNTQTRLDTYANDLTAAQLGNQLKR